MSMGAVLFRTGKMNGSELGGLYKSMPLDRRPLHRRRRLDLGLPAVLRLRLQVDGDGRRPRGGSSRSSGWRCCSPRPASSTMPASRSRSSPSSPTIPASATEEAPRNMLIAMGLAAVDLRLQRRLSVAALFAAAVPGGLRALYRDPRPHPDAAPVLLGAGVRLAEGLRALSAGTAERSTSTPNGFIASGCQLAGRARPVQLAARSAAIGRCRTRPFRVFWPRSIGIMARRAFWRGPGRPEAWRSGRRCCLRPICSLLPLMHPSCSFRDKRLKRRDLSD